MWNKNRDLLQQYGVRVFIVGKRDLLPQDVKDACDEIEAITAHNTRSVAPWLFWLSLIYGMY